MRLQTTVSVNVHDELPCRLILSGVHSHSHLLLCLLNQRTE